MILAIGEILYDNFPDYRVLGGAPFNVAVHLRRLGVPVHFFSRTGRDSNGAEIRKAVKELGFSVKDIQRDQRHPTGTVEIELDDAGKPTFDIIEDVAYDYLAYNKAIKTALSQDPAIIYFGTLVQRRPKGYKTIQRILNEKKKDSRCVYDVNLRPHCYSKEIIESSLSGTHVLKLNDEELDELQGMFNHRGSQESFTHRLFKSYPVEMIALTMGGKGAALITPRERCEAAPYPVESIADTVGAGDAFAAILAMGMLRSWKPQQILDNALFFASGICGVKGAIPQDNDIYTAALDHIAGE